MLYVALVAVLLRGVEYLDACSDRRLKEQKRQIGAVSEGRSF